MINKVRKIINSQNINRMPLKKLPDKLIWHRAQRLDYHTFIIFSTTNPNQHAQMICRKATQYLDGKREASLFISSIKSHPPGKGLGTALLNFAHKFSKEIGCGGRFFLSADAQFDPHKAPHIFYRKFGMNTSYKDINKKLDEFIKQEKNGTISDFPHVLMYYPPIEVKETPKQKFSLKENIQNYLHELYKFILKKI